MYLTIVGMTGQVGSVFEELKSLMLSGAIKHHGNAGNESTLWEINSINTVNIL